MKIIEKLKIVQCAALWYRGAFWQSQKSLTLNGWGTVVWSGWDEPNWTSCCRCSFFFYEKRGGWKFSQCSDFLLVTQGQIAVVTATSNFRILKCRIQAVVNFGTLVLIWDFCIHSTYLKSKKIKLMKTRLNFKYKLVVLIILR